MKKKGILSFDVASQRYDVIFDDGSRQGLHCGDCFDALIEGVWLPIRIEFSWDTPGWYLVDHSGISLDGLKVNF